MKALLERVGAAFSRLLPGSLTNRVFALYGATLVVFFVSGLSVFITHQVRQQIEETQRASVMLIEVVAQAVQDSAVIGDYDSVRKTLDRAVQGSVFRSAQFIDPKGGRIVVQSRSPVSGSPPAWLEQWAADMLYDVNRNITVGGRDYGVLRLRFDAHTVASELWGLGVLAVGAGLLSLALGLAPIHLLLSRWLGGLERLQAFDRALADGSVDPRQIDVTGAPSEVKRVVELFTRTADLIREREASRRALDNQKFALDQHAIVSITDLEGRITYANDRFCDITGYTRSELLGQNHRLINSGTQPREFFERLWQTIASGKVWRGEICNRNRQGHLYWVSATIVPLVDEKGRPEQYIAIRTDITERVKAERALEGLNQDLETQIRRRTQALEEATEMASQANRAKSDFLSNMSHEMRTPMNSILGMSHLALRAAPSPKVRQYLLNIHESGQHLLELISNILDFAKIESGKLDLESVDFSLMSVVQGVRTLMTDSASQKGLQLALDIDPVLSRPLRGDPLRFRQILLNYVSNAVKFSSAGTVRLGARALAPDDSGVTLRLEVQDQGIGMSEEQARSLFQPFQQADPSTSRRFGGTGLGLAICRKLAELMGGQVGVLSAPRQGSTFWLEVRLAWGQAVPEPGVAQAPSPNDDRWNELLRGVRVLVVDDNVLNQAVAGELLEAAGASVRRADDGQMALDLLAESPFDCVLMDMQMPVMDGLETTRRMRRDLDLVHLPVIAMTANARREDQAECLAAGMDDFLSKPVVPEDLYLTVAKWTRPDAAARPAPARVPAQRGASEPDSGEAGADIGTDIRTDMVAGAMADPAAPPLTQGAASPAKGPMPAGTRSPSQPSAAEVFDPAPLQSLTHGNARIMSELVAAFTRLMQATVPQMQQALAAGDAQSLGRLAHKIKSSSASLGAHALAQECRQLESAMRGEGPDLFAAADAVRRIEALTAQVQAGLDAALAHAQGGSGAGGAKGS